MIARAKVFDRLNYLPYDGDYDDKCYPMEIAEFATDLLGDDLLDYVDISLTWCPWSDKNELLVLADQANSESDDWDFTWTASLPDQWPVHKVERFLDRSANAIYVKPTHLFKCLHHRWINPFHAESKAHCLDCNKKVDVSRGIAHIGSSAFVSIPSKGKVWIRPIIRLNNVFVHPSLLPDKPGQFYNPCDPDPDKKVERLYTCSQLTTGAFLADFKSIVEAERWARTLDLMFPPYHSNQIFLMIKKTSFWHLFLAMRYDIENDIAWNEF